MTTSAQPLLVAAMASGLPEPVSAAVDAAFADPQVADAPALAALLRLPDHSGHEDIARLLQKLRAADSAVVAALHDTALAPPEQHMNVDDGQALARKCTWALADIGSAEARAALDDIAATSTDPVIAAYATRRLDLWEAEAARKGTRAAPAVSQD